MPIFYSKKCDIHISRDDTNNWVKTIPKLDVVYYDPPYNKHPYNIYYFMLDIINDWNLDADIPNTNRGQPKNWKQSNYNSLNKAKDTLVELIHNTNSSYIILSYNNGGIIPLNDLDIILKRFGTVRQIPVVHKTYNRLKGISNYKRQKDKVEIKEYLWILKKF